MKTKSEKFVPKPPYKRIREKSYVASFVGHYRSQTTNKSTGVVTINGEFDRTSLRKCIETMTDVVTPGFERIQAGGGIVNSPMTQASTSCKVSSSGFEVRAEDATSLTVFTESQVNPFYFGWPGHIPHSINVTNLMNYVSVKALAGMKPSNLQGLVALGEGAKTLRMLLNPLGSFSTLLNYVIQQRQAKRNLTIANVGNSIIINGRVFKGVNRLGRSPVGRYVTAPRTSIVVPIGQAVSGSVLANNLGLRPLLMDIESLLKQIPNLHKEPRLTSRSTLSDETTNSTASRVVNGIVSALRTVTTKTKVTVRASVLYEDKFDVLQDFGLSVLDIPSAAWELIPDSFLVDYLINIGDLLSASKMLMTRKILSSSLVVTTDIVTTAVFNDLVVSGFPTVTKALSETVEVTSNVKERIPQLNNPMIAYRPMSKILRPTVIQNTLSLIVQQLTHLGKGSKTPFF